MSKAELVLDARAGLGEGPLWNAAHKVLTWVDFLGEALHAFDPATGKDRVLLDKRRVSAASPCRDGGMILACADGLWRFEWEGGLRQKIADPEKDKAGVRFNDGKVDPWGRFWAGTMDEKQESAKGSLYRFDINGAYEVMLSPVMLSNGLGWSPDARTFYYIDTPTLQVRAWSADEEKGLLGEPRVVWQAAEGQGYPDGLCVDAEGMLWVALYLGGCVLRLDPSTGAVLQKVEVPGADRVTCPGFGGDKLDTLYITTAWENAQDEERARQPQAGGLYRFKPPAPGLPVSLCRHC